MKNIKYLLLIPLLAALILPSFTSAMTTEELTAKIKVLEQELNQLKTQLAQVQAQAQEWCHNFNKNLKIEISGEEVSTLHMALEKEGFNILDEEKSKKQFGESTASAISGFQQKYADEILAPLDLKYGTGFVGQNTRAKLNKLYGCGTKEISVVSTPETSVTSTPAPSPVLSPVATEQINEQVKCVFNGTPTEQKCHTTDTNFTCVGAGTCIVPIKGARGSTMAWTSSCGGSASTIMDGQDETIEFDCSNPAFRTTSAVAKTTEIITSRITNIISDSGDTFCVLTADNSAYCWTGTESVVHKVLGLGPVASIVTTQAGRNSCVVQTDGSALCWGDNFFGQLGDGTFIKREIPALVFGLGPGTTAAITLTPSSACALKKDGSVVCWGDNNGSQLGDGTLEGRLTPVQVIGLGPGTTAAIFSYGGGRCAIKTNGAVVCWGPIPLNGYDNRTTIPTQAIQFAPGTVKVLGFGFKLTCALKTDDSVVCSGSNYTGQAGNNQGKNALTMGIGTTEAITVGDYHSFALKKDGSVVGWGANGNAELGDGTATIRYTPVNVVGLGPGTTAAIATAFSKTCALKTDGSVVCWPMQDKHVPTPFIVPSSSSLSPPFTAMANVLESARQTLEQILETLKNR